MIKMIKNIFQGNGMEVSDDGSKYSYITNIPNAGNTQFNGTTFQISDGTTFTINGNGSLANTSLDKETLDILDWVKKKRNDELILEERAKSNNTLADLLNQRKELEEKIKIIEILTR